MLILSRKLNESIVIDGRIIVKVLRIDKDTVKLGIQAPAELPVHREEIHEVIQKNKLAAERNAAAGGRRAGHLTQPNGFPSPPPDGCPNEKIASRSVVPRAEREKQTKDF